jgi:hypothetical protein
MAGDDAPLASAQDGMHGDDLAGFENANLIGRAVHFDHAPAGCWSSGRSSAKCSGTTRLIVAWTRTLATQSSHCGTDSQT